MKEKPIARTYWCLNCKKIIEQMALKRERIVCPTCHSDDFVRQTTKYPKIPVNLQKRDAANRRKIAQLSMVLNARKLQLVFEHNIVASLKKYVPSREAFEDCLKLAKVTTIKKKKQLYTMLKNNGSIKSESDIGWRM